jgi:hypothetical protein
VSVFYRDEQLTDTALAIVAVLVILAVSLAAALGATIGTEREYFFLKGRECNYGTSGGKG